jgi:TrmH RNA methyltransferase
MTRVYGLSAALAVLAQRPEQVKNIAHTSAVRAQIGEALREAARRRIAYREVSDAELGRMAGSLHHEGICLLVKEQPLASLAELARRTEPRGLLLALDGVSNPHNVGAILRSAAFFGARGMIIAGLGGRRGGLPGAAVRIAAGAAEHVPIARVDDLAAALVELSAAGLTVVGADTHASAPLSELRWPESCVLVMGSEDVGLAKPVRARCDTLVRIAGSGAVESLNVSVAAGVVLASFAGAAPLGTASAGSAPLKRPKPRRG